MRVVAVAAVGAAEPGEVAEGCRTGPRARGEERLDRPCGGLRVGAATPRQLEAAVLPLMPPQECKRAPDRTAADVGRP